MRLSPLFHWAPTDRRAAIRSEGLRPFSDPTVCTGAHRYPYVSLSTTPSCAWGLSGDMDWVSEIESWDLWQVQLPERAETHVRALWGDVIEEVKVYTAIPADCLWLIGTREPVTAEAV